MTREEWEDVLYAAVPDEIVQDQLNDYVLSLEWEVAKLRELLTETLMPIEDYAKKYGIAPYFLDVNDHIDARMRELGIEVE